MSAAHTPGPLSVCADTDCTPCLGHEGHGLPDHEILSPSIHSVASISRIFKDGKRQPDIERANAYLFAAAPELLATLRRATEMCEAYSDWIKRNVMSASIEEHPYLPELDGVAEDARAAIAKATHT